MISSYTLLLAGTALVASLGGAKAQTTLDPVPDTCPPASTVTVISTVYVTATTTSTASLRTSTTSMRTSTTSRTSTKPTTTSRTSVKPTTTSTTSLQTRTTSTAAPITTSTSNSPPIPTDGSWFKPTPGASFLWSLERAIPANPVGRNNLALKNIQVYDVDLFESTPAQISQYKAQGKKVVCYFSAGSFEDWRDDADSFTKACYCNAGNSCKMDGWDEWWLDLATPACITNVQAIMKKRLELAKSKGCDAVEPDTTDSYTNEAGWKTTITNQFNYLRYLSDTAHSLGLGIALKNGPDMIQNRPEIVQLTDFVVIEECQAYNECGVYSPFVNAGKAAFQVEYERTITCSQILPGFFALAYSSYDVDYKNVQAICPKS